MPDDVVVRAHDRRVPKVRIRKRTINFAEIGRQQEALRQRRDVRLSRYAIPTDPDAIIEPAKVIFTIHQAPRRDNAIVLKRRPRPGEGVREETRVKIVRLEDKPRPLTPQEDRDAQAVRGFMLDVARKSGIKSPKDATMLIKFKDGRVIGQRPGMRGRVLRGRRKKDGR